MVSVNRIINVLHGLICNILSRRIPFIDYASPLSPMDAEKSILVEKTPTVSRRKVTKTNTAIDEKRFVPTTGHSTGKRVTITTNTTDTPKHQHPHLPPNDILPTPDYPQETPGLQVVPKQVVFPKSNCNLYKGSCYII